VIHRFIDGLPANQQKLAAEPYINPENYVKHNNNWGFVHPLNRNTPQAFSHFSWEFTGHRFMVVDIQGVGDVYTDPQIHSADDNGEGDGPWGMGNMGMQGIQKFLDTHRCNAVCQCLGLQPTAQPLLQEAGTAMPGTVAPQTNARNPRWSSQFRVADFIRDIKPVRDGVTPEDLSLMKMTLEEFNQIVDLFNRHDLDGNGVLTMDEVVPLLGTLQFHFSPENTQYLLQLSPNGEVSFKQFIMWYKGLN